MSDDPRLATHSQPQTTHEFFIKFNRHRANRRVSLVVAYLSRIDSKKEETVVKNLANNAFLISEPSVRRVFKIRDFPKGDRIQKKLDRDR